MTFEQKLQIFQSLLEFAIYEYKFIEFLKFRVDLIEIKLTKANNTIEILDFLEELYQYFKESYDI